MFIKRTNSFSSFLKNVQNVIAFLSHFCNNCEILNFLKIFHTFIKTLYDFDMSNHIKAIEYICSVSNYSTESER